MWYALFILFVLFVCAVDVIFDDVSLLHYWHPIAPHRFASFFYRVDKSLKKASRKREKPLTHFTRATVMRNCLDVGLMLSIHVRYSRVILVMHDAYSDDSVVLALRASPFGSSSLALFFFFAAVPSPRCFWCLCTTPHPPQDAIQTGECNAE